MQTLTARTTELLIVLTGAAYFWYIGIFDEHEVNDYSLALRGTTDNNDYALGWIVLKRSWANGRADAQRIKHDVLRRRLDGPDKNCAVIVASNIGADEAFQGCDEAAGKLINQYFRK